MDGRQPWLPVKRLKTQIFSPGKGPPRVTEALREYPYDSGEGHQVFVLTVTYPGGRTRQFSVRRERVAEVRRWLSNYQELKGAIEAVCELNHDLLRPQRTASKPRRKPHD